MPRTQHVSQVRTHEVVRTGDGFSFLVIETLSTRGDLLAITVVDRRDYEDE